MEHQDSRVSSFGQKRTREAFTEAQIDLTTTSDDESYDPTVAVNKGKRRKPNDCVAKNLSNLKIQLPPMKNGKGKLAPGPRVPEAQQHQAKTALQTISRPAKRSISPEPQPELMPLNVPLGKRFTIVNSVRVDLPEALDQQGKQLEISEVQYERDFIPTFLKGNWKILLNLNGGIIQKSFRSYLETYYSNQTGVRLNRCITSQWQGKSPGKIAATALNQALKDRKNRENMLMFKPEKSVTAGPKKVESEKILEAQHLDPDPFPPRPPSGNSRDASQKGPHAAAPLSWVAVNGLQSDDPATTEKYYPKSETGRCLVCCKSGHARVECPALQCAACSVQGVHFTRACPLSQRCTKCKELGHVKSNCPEKLMAARSSVESCLRCGLSNHQEADCSYLWRSFEASPCALRIASLAVFCYSCGASGHFGTECGIRRQGKLLSNGITWSRENLNKYLDAHSERSVASHIPLEPATVRTVPNRDYSIKGMSHRHPIEVDDEEGTGSLFTTKVQKSKKPGKIHIQKPKAKALQPPLPPGPPPPRNAPNGYNQSSQHDGHRRNQREPSYSPPPAIAIQAGYGIGPNSATNGYQKGAKTFFRLDQSSKNEKRNQQSLQGPIDYSGKQDSGRAHAPISAPAYESDTVTDSYHAGVQRFHGESTPASASEGGSAGQQHKKVKSKGKKSITQKSQKKANNTG